MKRTDKSTHIICIPNTSAITMLDTTRPHFEHRSIEILQVDIGTALTLVEFIFSSNMPD